MLGHNVMGVSCFSLIPTLYEELKREKEDFPETQAASIGLTSAPAKKTTKSNEDDDLALGTRALRIYF